MKCLELLHGRCVHPRRLRVLAGHLSEMIPTTAKVLDVGCGDGQLTLLLGRSRPDLKIEGIDVLVRPESAVKVTAFDGQAIPFPNGSFDVVMFVDVLHHTQNPVTLLAEAARVARRSIVIKDHLLQGFLAQATLAFMDRVGNRRHGVSLPYNYWTHAQWLSAFEKLSLRIQDWRNRLGLYPVPGRFLFDRSLHFLAKLSIAT